MSITFIKSECLPLTRQLAIDFSEMRSVPGERKIRPKRMKFHRQNLTTGKWTCPTWAIGFIGDDPEPWRGDGQHTSLTLKEYAQSTEAFPAGLQVVIKHYHLDSLEDRSEFFDMFDHPDSCRTNEDKLGTYAAQWPELQGSSLKFVSKILRGISYYQEHKKTDAKPKKNAAPADEEPNPQFKKLTGREIGTMLKEPRYREFVLWAPPLDEMRNKSFLSKVGIMAQIFEDWNSAPNLAGQFWTWILEESHPDNDHVTRELARQFNKWSEKGKTVHPDRFFKEARDGWLGFWRKAALAAETATAPPAQPEQTLLMPTPPPAAAPEIRAQI